METAEAVVNFKEVENDLKLGMMNAESNTSEQGQKTVLPNGKPALDFGAPAIKVLCRVKNNIQFSMVTKGLPDDVKSKLQHFNTVEDNEVILYKKALDQYGEEHLPPEIIELVNKYSNSSLAPLIEWEIEKFKRMRAEVVLLMKEVKEEKKND